MTDVANLVLAVNSTQVKDGERALGRLTDAGGKAEGATRRLTDASNLLSKAAGMVAVGFGAIKLTSLIRESATLAARYETMGVVMRVAGNNAGYTGAQMLALQKQMQATGISMLKSREVLTSMSAANLDLAKATQLARAAQDLAVVGNTNSSEALARLVHGIKSGEVEILKTLGLNVSFEASYKTLAAQLGTTSDKLTEQQKVMARTNIALQGAAGYAGIYEESMTTAGKAITSLTRYWEDLKVKAGEAFLPMLADSVFNLTDALKAANVELDKAGSSGTIDAIGSGLGGAFRTVYETVVVLGANVGYVLTSIGREIGGIAAQASALLRGDFAGASAIRQSMVADAEAARKAIDAFSDTVINGAKKTAGATKMTEQARIDAGKAAREQAEADAKAAAAADEAAKAAKKHAQEYASLIKGAQDYLATLQAETHAVGLSADQLRMVAAAREAAKAPTQALRESIMKEALALDIATKAWEEKTAAEKYAADAVKTLLDASNQEIDAIYGQIEATRLQIDTFGMSASAVTGATIAQLEYKLALLEISDWEGVATQALRDRITALRELQGLQGNKEALEGQKRMTDELEKDAKASHERIAQSLTDNIMRGGKSAGQYLKDYFRTLILRPIIQPVGNAVAGMLNGGGGLSSLMGIGSGLGGVLNTAGSFLGINSLSNFGAGMQGATLAPGLAGPTTAGAGGATGLGAQIGSAMPIIAAAVMSYFGARAISNGYEINGIGKLLNFGGLAGGVLNRAFGMRPRENGLGGFQGNFSDAGFTNGQTFQRWNQAGGWFRSDRSGTDYGALDANFSQQLTDTYTALRDANTQYAESLGLTTDAVRGYAKEFILALSGNEAQDAQTLAVEFAKINNELAERLLPNFAEFARTGEDAATTLQRLAIEYQTVDTVLTAIGNTFGAVGIGSAAARSRLIELSGGLESFAAGAAFYAENFLTEAQRLEPVQAAVTAEMARLGLASVTTHEQFVQAARGIDLTTEAGAQLYADMMRVAGAFDAVADAEQRRVDAISGERAGLQQRLNELTLTSAELLQLQRDALDESNRGLFDQISALEAQRVATADAARATEQAAADAAKAAQDYADSLQTALDTAMRGVDTAFAGLQRSVQAERDAITKSHTAAMDAINERVQTVTGSIGKLTQLSNSLRSTLDRMRLPSQFGADRAAAQAQIAAAVAIARAGGVLPDADEIGRALNTLTQPAERMFRSSFEFQRDAIRNQNMIAELATLTDDQLTTERQMLSALEDSRDLAQATYEGEMSRLDGILTSAQLQIDILNGLDTRLLTIDQSLARFAGSLTTAGAAQAAVASNTGSTASTVTGLFSNILGREARPEGAAFWTNALATNSTYLTGQNSLVRDFIEGAVNAGGTDAERAIAYARANGIPGFSSGGDAGGMYFAGEAGPELIMSGPRTVVNSTSTRRMMQDGADLVVAVRELVATINAQGNNQEARDIAIVKNTGAVARIVDRWDGNGAPVRAHANIPIPVDTTP